MPNRTIRTTAHALVVALMTLMGPSHDDRRSHDGPPPS
jgi:hypothetical protein